jgi:hypothetical protein
MSFQQHIFLAFSRVNERIVRKTVEEAGNHRGLFGLFRRRAVTRKRVRKSKKGSDFRMTRGKAYSTDQVAQMDLLGLPAEPVQRAEPPALAELVVAFLAKTKHKDALLGDLDEKFRGAIDRGWTIDRARRMYWAEAMRAVGPLAWQKLKRLGIIGLLAVAAKKFLS